MILMKGEKSRFAKKERWYSSYAADLWHFLTNDNKIKISEWSPTINILRISISLAKLNTSNNFFI